MQAMGLVKELRNLQGPNFAVKLQAHLQSKNNCTPGWTPCSSFTLQHERVSGWQAGLLRAG